jgi:hypothetical protein
MPLTIEYARLHKPVGALEVSSLLRNCIACLIISPAAPVATAQPGASALT